MIIYTSYTYKIYISYTYKFKEAGKYMKVHCLAIFFVCHAPSSIVVLGE